MTCIVALKTPEEIIFAGDSLVSIDQDIFSLKNPKVWEQNGMLWGVAGNLRAQNILQHNLELIPRNPQSKRTPEEYANGTVVAQIRDAFRRTEFMQYNAGREEISSRILFTVENHIYFLDVDLGLTELQDDYVCIGTGAPYAMASMFTTEKSRMTPENRVNIALKTAEKFNSLVSGPFEIVRMPIKDGWE